MSYLEELLEQQRVDPAIEEALRARRVEVEALLRGPGSPRFYYGGSFGKKTMIAAQFDLDVVVYFPPGTAAEPGELYEAVERRLRAAGHHVARHNVALRLRYTPGWHIDVVPGRALDESYEYADLYASETATHRRTSLKRHIALAREGDRDVIRLLKLWRCRHAVPVGSFVLELAAARALRGVAGSLEERFATVLAFLADAFPEARLTDPANPENVVTDDLDWGRKRAIADAARSVQGSPWSRVVW
jgi:hypothetical protein